MQIIISCDDLVSMDTWIKTFMALCGKSAHVIKTRFHSSYREIGRESCDHIFFPVRLRNATKSRTMLLKIFYI